MDVRFILSVSVALHCFMGLIKWLSLRRAQRGWTKQIVTSRPSPRLGFVASMFGYLGWLMGSVTEALGSGWFPPLVSFDERVGTVILFLGHALFGLTLWAIGPSFGLRPQVIAEHRLVKRGPYRFVRHPMYAALHTIYLGTFLLVPSWFFLICMIAAVLGNAIRAREEERVLLQRYGQEYAAYQKTTSRFFPRVFRGSPAAK